jgi:flavin-dependent dehydrogenase
MTTSLGPLCDLGRVVIIGGGPGGAACALALHELSKKMGHDIEIIILEGKHFLDEHHYNQCVGVLSPPLPDLLEDHLGIPFPYHLSRCEIKGYILHTSKEEVFVADEEETSIALRRVQFDAYMFEMAKQKGVKVIPARAVDLEFHADNVVVYTENVPVECDVVVGAFGMDEGTASLFARQTGYRPPEALSSVVTKFHPGFETMKNFGHHIHAFLPENSRIEFGGVSPKGNHLTINIAGRTVDTALMRAFLKFPTVSNTLPDLSKAGQLDARDMLFFKGRFPCSLAKRYYGDRYVIIGDAAGLVRAFKGKGVTSAVQTGIRAAETIMHTGCSRQAFHNDYRKANHDLIQDLPYGQVMRFVTILMSRYRLLNPVMRAAKRNSHLQASLFGAISAHAPYRQVLSQALHPGAILEVLKALL